MIAIVFVLLSSTNCLACAVDSLAFSWLVYTILVYALVLVAEVFPYNSKNAD